MPIDAEQLPEPGTQQWTAALALRKALRCHPGPRHGQSPAGLAGAIVADLERAGWRFIKEPPSAAHSTPGE